MDFNVGGVEFSEYKMQTSGMSLCLGLCEYLHVPSGGLLQFQSYITEYCSLLC